MSLFVLDRRAAIPTSRSHDGENNYVVSGVEVFINVEMNLLEAIGDALHSVVEGIGPHMGSGLYSVAWVNPYHGGMQQSRY